MSTTPIGRVSFPHLYEPVAFQGGEPKHTVTLLFDADADLSKMKKLAEKVARDRWPSKLPKDLVSPFRDGTEYNDWREEEGNPRLEGYDGCTFVRFTSKSRPKVVNQKVKEIMHDDGMVYAGCYAIVAYSCFAYSVSGNRGVSFGISCLQFIKNGEPFDGRPKPEDVFVPVEIEEDEDEDEGEAVDDDMDEMFK